MFTRARSAKRKAGTVPVHLNVYDLTPINGYAYWLGLGVYHSGVQVHGVEYAYGAHDHPTTGIFEAEPRQCPGFAFRKSILIGRTELGPREVRALMEELAKDYIGNTYDLISKNCNHFCNDVCLRLVGKPIPRWVNRLAKIGFLCNCVLPGQVAEARRRAAVAAAKGASAGDGETRKLRSSQSTRYATTTASSTDTDKSTTSAAPAPRTPRSASLSALTSRGRSTSRRENRP